MQQQYSTTKHVQYPAVVDDVVILPPNSVEVSQQPASVETNLGFVVTVANLAVTAILITGMLLNGSQVQNAIITGGIYFAATTTAFVFVITGALTAMVNGWQREKTERQRIMAYRELGEMSIGWKLAVEETRQLELMGRRGGAGDVQRVSPLNSFVPAIADGEEAQAEGVRFAMSLFDTRGNPDGKRLHPDGRLKIKMCGSKRGSGSREAGLWLLREGIIRRVRGGYALAVDKYPTRDSLRMYL